jgi:molybdate transport system substrate-binding protein
MRRVRRLIALLAATMIAACAPPGGLFGATAFGAEVRIMSSANMRQILSDLTEAIEGDTGLKIVIEFAEGGVAHDRVMRGQTFDLTINAKDLIEQIRDKGKITGSPIDIARATISVAVRKGAPRPDIGTIDAIKKWLSGPQLISYSEQGISGLALKRGIAQLDVAEAFKKHSIAAPNGDAAVALLKTEKAEIAIVQTFSTVGVSDIDVVGRLPKEMVGDILVSGAILNSAAQTEAGQILTYLSSPAARKVIQARGLEVP